MTLQLVQQKSLGAVEQGSNKKDLTFTCLSEDGKVKLVLFSFCI